MGRLKGLGSFVLVAAAAVLLLRAAHLVLPVFFPGTRPGPIAVASLDEARRRLGFPPFVPAYRPASLGERPPRLVVKLGPEPSFEAVWRGQQFLSVTQRRGGPRPHHPPISQPLAGVPGSTWWMLEGRHHLIFKKGDFWLEVVTDLSLRDLRRIADTLGSH